MQEVAGVSSSNGRLGPTRVACGVIFPCARTCALRPLLPRLPKSECPDRKK